MAEENTRTKTGLKISYNAPVILSFTLLCTLILIVDNILPGLGFINHFFTVPSRNSGFHFLSPDFYKLVSHAAGHGNWSHLVGNFTFILLIGPILEEKYGPGKLILMMFITALITGILNVLFFSHALLGASGIVFMLILLTSFTNIRSGQIPLTFILIVLLFLGQEVYKAFFQPENRISEFAHIIGGICGAVFGFFFSGKKATSPQPDRDTSGE